ncbi:MAG TPA: hypothetical protein VGJ66_08525 [Pyrinomonadaceae bacterium]|jgi:hypothetical protein
MALSGEERRIRALFRELRLEDERVMPRFAAVWNRAHIKSARRKTAVDFRMAVAVVIVCFALFSLAFLSRHWQRKPRSIDAVASGAVKPEASPAQIKKDPELVQQVRRVIRRPRRLGFAPRSQAAKLALRRSTTRDAIALSRWRSPTATLLRSPGDEVFRTLPQLNQNLHEMEAFLPNGTN